MCANSRTRPGRKSERGITLYVVAAGLVMMLCLCALAIDLVAGYVGRNEAQRVADAAALAGATYFIDQGCTTTGGCVAGGPQEAPATSRATTVANQNTVFGQTASITTSFSYPNPEEPQITVNATCSVPTFFSKIFGVQTMPVAVTATAEAYNPSGGATPAGAACLKPFLVPNCDPGHPVAGSSPVASTICSTISGGTCTSTSTDCQSYFFYPSGTKQGQIVNNSLCTSWVVDASGNTAGHCTAGGAIGEAWELHDENGPSQWYQLQFAGESGSNLRQAIQQCAFQTVACNQPLNALNGAKVGPTDQGTDALINASSDGPNQGQDTICNPVVQSCTHTTLPFWITGGSGNQNGASGLTFTDIANSSSVVSVAVYDGHDLPPGNGQLVTIIGFMQIFVVDAQGPSGDGTPPPGFSTSKKTVDAIIMSIGGCGSSTSTTPPVVSNGGSFVPIRLIHQ